MIRILLGNYFLIFYLLMIVIRMFLFKIKEIFCFYKWNWMDIYMDKADFILNFLFIIYCRIDVFGYIFFYYFMWRIYFL